MSIRFGLSLLLLSSLSLSAADREAEIRAVIQRYVDVRDHPDAPALAQLFSADTDQLVSSGEWRKGRDAVVKGTIAASQKESGKRTITVESVRFLTKDVALADGRYDLFDASGTATRHMWSSIVLVRQHNAWHITAIRNMLPAR